MECNGQGLAHQAAGAQGAVQPRHGAHFKDLLYSAALFAHQPSGGPVKLNFGTGVGLVAELVFQALDAHVVERAAICRMIKIRQHARQKQARQTHLGLRQHEECIAHRGREKPFVTDQGEAFSPRIRAIGCGARGVGPHV